MTKRVLSEIACRKLSTDGGDFWVYGTLTKRVLNISANTKYIGKQGDVDMNSLPEEQVSWMTSLMQESDPVEM